MDEMIMEQAESTPTEEVTEGYTEEVTENEETTEQTEEVESQPEEELYPIKVKGEEKRVPLNELIQLAQMGDDYTRKTQELAIERKLANKLREMGHDPVELLEQWEQEQLQAQAETLGVSPELYQRMTQMEQELGFYKRESTYAKQDVELSQDPIHGQFYTQWRDDVKSQADRLGVDLNTAYTILLRERVADVITSTKRQGEQSAIKNIVSRDNASVGSVNGTPATLKTDFANMPADDFKQMLERAKRGELRNI